MAKNSQGFSLDPVTFEVLKNAYVNIVDQMAEQIKRYQAGLETYLLAITRAQEEERARLSRELHDETVQSLIAFDHKVSPAPTSPSFLTFS